MPALFPLGPAAAAQQAYEVIEDADDNGINPGKEPTEQDNRWDNNRLGKVIVHHEPISSHQEEEGRNHNRENESTADGKTIKHKSTLKDAGQSASGPYRPSGRDEQNAQQKGKLRDRKDYLHPSFLYEFRGQLTFFATESSMVFPDIGCRHCLGELARNMNRELNVDPQRREL